MKYCPYCGAGLDEDMRFCPKCGKPFEDGKENPHIESISAADKYAVNNPPVSPSASETKPKKKKYGGLIAIIFIVILIVIIGGLYYSGTIRAKKAFSDDLEAIEKVSNSVVMISCYDKKGNLLATGSGFIAFEDNAIVTNYHVIDCNVYSITVQTEDNRSFDCPTILAFDAVKDLAILQTASRTGLSLLPIGDVDSLKKGEKVIAIGSPLGLINTISNGVFSGLVVENGQTYLQFSAAISHGSSGGALFDDNGKVIGITSASFVEGQNLNLAIPIENAVQIWEKAGSPVSLKDLYIEPMTVYTVKQILDDYSQYDNETFAVQGYLSYDLHLVSSAKEAKGDPTKDISDPTQAAQSLLDYYLTINKTSLTLEQHSANDLRGYSMPAYIGSYVYVEGTCHVHYAKDGSLGYITFLVDTIKTIQ